MGSLNNVFSRKILWGASTRLTLPATITARGVILCVLRNSSTSDKTGSIYVNGTRVAYIQSNSYDGNNAVAEVFPGDVVTKAGNATTIDAYFVASAMVGGG